MKGSILFLFILFAVTSSLYSQVQWSNFNRGLFRSKAERKMIIVDVYTDWCTWCKKMDKSTYGHSGVADLIKRKFVAIKLNAEADEKVEFNGVTYSNRELTQAFRISGYPATVILSDMQEPLTVIPGYIEAPEFMNILRYFGEGEYKKKSYEEFLKK